MNIPDHIARAVYEGDMPFPIFADWLDDLPWPQAANAFRLMDTRGLAIENLQVVNHKIPNVFSEKLYLLWRDSHNWLEIGKLCEAVAWGVVDGTATKTLDKPWKRRSRGHRRCCLCNQKRQVNEGMLCKPCHKAHKDLVTIYLPFTPPPRPKPAAPGLPGSS